MWGWDGESLRSHIRLESRRKRECYLICWSTVQGVLEKFCWTREWTRWGVWRADGSKLAPGLCVSALSAVATSSFPGWYWLNWAWGLTWQWERYQRSWTLWPKHGLRRGLSIENPAGNGSLAATFPFLDGLKYQLGGNHGATPVVKGTHTQAVNGLTNGKSAEAIRQVDVQETKLAPKE